jgi:two-component system cell cycle sensor histidine kinase PleC
MEYDTSGQWRVEPRNPSQTVSEIKGMLDDLTRLISDWVWETDTNFRLKYVSANIFESLGIPADDAVGKRLPQLGTFRSASGAPLELDYRKPFRDIQFDSEDRTGNPRSLVISGLPIFDPVSGEFLGARGISKDVTASKKEREVSDQLGLAIENFSESYLMTDPAGRIILANRKFRELNRQVSQYNVPGTPFEDHLRAAVSKGLIPEAIGKEDEWISYRLYLHRHPHGSFEIQRHGNKVLRISEEKLPNGSTSTISIDITKLKAAENVLHESAKRNREFTLNAAHQLRTPLGVLRANIDNMDDKVTAKSLRQDVVSMTRIVEQLLDGKRWESIDFSDEDKVDITEVCRNVLTAMAPDSIKKSKSLDLDAPNEPVWVNGVYEPIEGAICNLVDNAIKYSTPKTSISVSVTRDGKVSVEDQGPGISEADRERIMDSNLKIDRRGSHMGLGLEIVKSIAKSHNAAFELETGIGKGSVFSIHFPNATTEP